MITVASINHWYYGTNINKIWHTCLRHHADKTHNVEPASAQKVQEFFPNF